MKVREKKEFGVIQMLMSESTLWFSEQVPWGCPFGVFTLIKYAKLMTKS